jgi:hypothetical protein
MTLVAIAISFFVLGFLTHDPIQGAFHASRGRTRVVTLRDAAKARRPRGPRRLRSASQHDPAGEAGA